MMIWEAALVSKLFKLAKWYTMMQNNQKVM